MHRCLSLSRSPGRERKVSTRGVGREVDSLGEVRPRHGLLDGTDEHGALHPSGADQEGQGQDQQMPDRREPGPGGNSVVVTHCGDLEDSGARPSDELCCSP